MTGEVQLRAGAKSVLPLLVILSNHDSGNGSILRQAQDERKPKKPITLHRPWSATGHALTKWL